MEKENKVNVIEVYITKYALTEGILKKQVEKCNNNRVKEIGEWSAYFHQGDWHETYANALAKAKGMKARKITSLKKQLARIETLTFPVNWLGRDEMEEGPDFDKGKNHGKLK